MNPIKKNAEFVLKILVEDGNEQYDNSQIRGLTSLSPQDVSDAISYLNDLGAIESHSESGMRPFNFSFIRIKSKARYLYHEFEEKLSSEMVTQDLNEGENIMVRTLKEITVQKEKSINVLKIFDDVNVKNVFDSLEKAINKIAQSWSKSWIGYHASIYYTGFTAPQHGDNFSVEWGFTSIFNNPVSDNWRQYSYEQVIDAIFYSAKINRQDMDMITNLIDASQKSFQESKNDFIAIIEIFYNENKEKFLEKILDEATEAKVYTQAYFINKMSPTQAMTRDSEALAQGIMIPPHIAFKCLLFSLQSLRPALENLINCQKKAEKYFINILKENTMDSTHKYVFIGHGHSNVWKDLKDFLQDRLKLTWDEFNREPTAGISTTERLQELLDNSNFAFIVMTAEDEHSDGNKHARENVIHEAGLFQGKLGFRKTTLLLEENCTEFSNIVGLGQIRFPKGKIESKFEEIRRVLEREKIIRI